MCRFHHKKKYGIGSPFVKVALNDRTDAAHWSEYTQHTT